MNDDLIRRSMRLESLMEGRVMPVMVCLTIKREPAVDAVPEPPGEDNWVDLAGYAACGGEIETG